MKKNFTILCTMLLSLGVFAQAQFGATAGLNMANVVGEDMETDMKMGMHVGVSAAFELSDAMTLKTGALYSTKVTEDSEDGIKVSMNLSYIEIPLNLSFAISDQMSLMVGPYIGLLMGVMIIYSPMILKNKVDFILQYLYAKCPEFLISLN